MLAVGNNRQHGGNEGYDDDPEVHYSWDDTVANHAAVSVGDAIAVWDKTELLGASVIEEILVSTGQKVLRRCPSCKRAKLKERSTKRPRFRCYDAGCQAEFDSPTIETAIVKTYRSRHDAGWVDLRGVLNGRQLRNLCESPKSMLSMRALRWTDFVSEVSESESEDRLLLLDKRGPTTPTSDGHIETTVRVRRGQESFRRRLLQQYGAACALTGPAPEAALEAAHLYSYAALGQHDVNGGLLLRRDIHRLFDEGTIAVEPQSLRIDVDPSILIYPDYASLAGRPVRVDVNRKMAEWLERHWEIHRPE